MSRPKGPKFGGGKYLRGKNAEADQPEELMERLAAFEQFNEEILPILQEDVRKKVPAKDVLQKVMTLAAARLATLAMTESDPTRALAIIKEIFDRVEGKSVERAERKHKFENLKPDQLDALLLSEMAALETPKKDEAN